MEDDLEDDLEDDMHIPYRKLSLVLLGLMLIVITCTCQSNPPDSSSHADVSETDSWAAAVDDIKALTRNKPIPRHLLDPEQPATEDVFDPNQLLIPLKHLSLQEGYTLDFVYRNEGIGANPILYVRKETQPPLASFEDYQKVVDDCDGVDKTPGCDYIDFIQSDGTEEGYFQWILLRMMGEQFYLYWHANYKDSEVIASKAQLESLVEAFSADSFGVSLSSSQKRAALRIDPTPAVSIEGDLVTVRVVWFTKWGGFFESKYTITAGAPHQVVQKQTESLVEYDCQILF